MGDEHPKKLVIKSIKETRKIALKESSVYEMGVKQTPSSSIIADVLFARTYGRDHLALFNEVGAVGKEFYKIVAIKIDRESLALYLNSTFAVMQRELFGIVNLGGGAIKFSAFDIENFLIPSKLVNEKINFPQKESFFNREIKTFFKECGINPESEVSISEQEPQPLPDRAELDNIVFDALGLTKEERKEVYRAVCQLVWNRVSKARSV